MSLLYSSLEDFQPHWTGFLIIGIVFFSSLCSAVGLCFLSRSHGSAVTEPAEYQGIGGWLILVIIGMVVRVYKYGQTALTATVLCCNQTKWTLLTDPDSTAYHPLWGAALLYEACSCTIILVASILAFVLLFLKKFTYPYVMVGLIGGAVVFHVVDHLICRQIPAANTNDIASGILTFQLLLVAAIWIPYFLVSKRVKATFTR